jgi:hypothetical protein
MFFTVINKCTDLKKNNYELKKKKHTTQKTCSDMAEKLLG